MPSGHRNRDGRTLSRKTCERCGKEFLIVNDAAMIEDHCARKKHSRE